MLLQANDSVRKFKEPFSFAFLFLLGFVLLQDIPLGLGLGRWLSEQKHVVHKHERQQLNLQHPRNKLEMACVHPCDFSTG